MEQATPSPTLSWQGRYFEDFTVGDVYRHPLGRAVLAPDNSWLTLLTQNTAALHFDAAFAAQTEWPSACGELGFAQAASPRAIASRASGKTGVVAAWSR